MSMVGDLQRLQDISHELSVAIERPSVLPEKSVEYLAEICPLAALTSDFQGSIIVCVRVVICLHVFQILYHLACDLRLVAVLLHSLCVVHHQLQDYHDDHKALIS